MRLAVMTGVGTDAWAAEWAAGRRPSQHPYGVDKLRDHGWDLDLLSPRPRGRLATKLKNVVEHRTGMPIDSALTGVSRVKGADAVLGLLEPEATAASLLRRLRIPPYARTPVTAICCWAAERWLHGESAEHHRALRQVRNLDRVYVLSRNQAEIYADMGVDPHRIVPIRFGIDEEFYTPNDSVDDDVDLLAVGLDGGRDYGTLFAAIEPMDVHLTLVAMPHNLAGLRVPANVTFLGSVEHVTYRDLLRRARLVVVPTHERAYPTGQSVALEAAAVGAPLAITWTPAMADYFTPGRNALMPQVGAVEEWREVICELLGDAPLRHQLSVQAREDVLGSFTTSHLWQDIHADLSQLVDQ